MTAIHGRFSRSQAIIENGEHKHNPLCSSLLPFRVLQLTAGSCFFVFLVFLKVLRLTVKIKTEIRHYTSQLDTDMSSSLTHSSLTKPTQQSKQTSLLFFCKCSNLLKAAFAKNFRAHSATVLNCRWRWASLTGCHFPNVGVNLQLYA